MGNSIFIIVLAQSEVTYAKSVTSYAGGRNTPHRMMAVRPHKKLHKTHEKPQTGWAKISQTAAQ